MLSRPVRSLEKPADNSISGATRPGPSPTFVRQQHARDELEQVLFPVPFLPMMPTVSPASMLNDTCAQRPELVPAALPAEPVDEQLPQPQVAAAVADELGSPRFFASMIGSLTTAP